MTKYFTEQGITQIIIQPEFMPAPQKNIDGIDTLRQNLNMPCLMQCMTEVCRKRHCCVEKKLEKKRNNLENVKKIEQQQQQQTDITLVV